MRARKLGLRLGVSLGLSLCALSSCGFQLRTWQLDGNVETILVANQTKFIEVGTDLERAITQAGVTLLTQVDTERTPDLQVQLLQAAQDRRSVSVGGDARAAEYELSLEVNYALLDANNVELSEPRWIRVQRVYRLNRNNLMGSNEEENILQREMRTDVVQQILRAINQVVSPPASESESESESGSEPESDPEPSSA
jgi:LPS-assembly lipoprotein